jgi:valyl-tRNA synthetase
MSRLRRHVVATDPDVLDTWFFVLAVAVLDSRLAGWKRRRQKPTIRFHTHHRFGGFLFFWVGACHGGIESEAKSRSAMSYLNGTVRDAQGRKMSKSLGNGIDPLEVVNLFGADALRYTVIAGTGLGTDLFLDNKNLEETFAPGRNFANKVWNAGRFALMNLGDADVADVADCAEDLELADSWILSRLSVAVTNVTRALESFRFHEATETVYHFFWSELADWYLELIKPRFL